MTPKLKPSQPGSNSRRGNAPSCRGGASSLLRLSQPGSARLPSAQHLAGWVQRAAAMFRASPRAQAHAPGFSVSEYGVGSTG